MAPQAQKSIFDCNFMHFPCFEHLNCSITHLISVNHAAEMLFCAVSHFNTGGKPGDG